MQTFVTVHGERAADFEQLFGTATVRVKGMCPNWAVVPEHELPQLVFELDLDWVHEGGFRDALVAHISQRFGETPAFVERELEDKGVPILAMNCTVNGRDFL